MMGTSDKPITSGIAVVVLPVVTSVLQNSRAAETEPLPPADTMPSAALLSGTRVTRFAIGGLTAGHAVSGAGRVWPEWPRRRRAVGRQTFCKFSKYSRDRHVADRAVIFAESRSRPC